MTWHNAGFWVADILAREAGVSFINAGLFKVAELPDGPDLIKPLDYMNRSGSAIAAFLDSKGYSAEEMIVVCDDINIDLGCLRLRSEGSHGGHNGLRNIIDCLGTENFPRLRIGIGPPPAEDDLAEFVLQRISGELEDEVSLMAHKAADCVTMFVRQGIAPAQERYNRKDP